MTNNTLKITLKAVVPGIVEQYMKKRAVNWDVAIEVLYNSALYRKMENSQSEYLAMNPCDLCDILIKETDELSVAEEQKAWTTK